MVGFKMGCKHDYRAYKEDSWKCEICGKIDLAYVDQLLGKDITIHYPKKEAI